MIKRYFKYIFVSMLFLSGLALKTQAQDVKVEASLHQVSIRIGDQTTFHLIAHIPAKSSITFPQLADSIGKIQIVNVARRDTIIDKSNPAQETIVQNYTLTGFEAGAYKIPQYTFHTDKGTFTTDSLLLEFTTVKVDTTKGIYDIKQPLAVNYSFWDWLRDNWRWLVIALVVIPLLVTLIVLGIVTYLKKRRKNEVVKPDEPIIPAHVTALNKLQALRDKKLWQQDEVKLYYIELTDTIRDYLEKRYHIQAHEQTSDEIFAGLKYKELQEDDRDKLRQILLLADLVKFAKEKPVPAENEQSMDNAISFIMQTTPVELPPVTKEELPK